MASTNFEFQRNIPFTEFIDNNSWLQNRDPAFYLAGFVFLFTCVMITQSWIILSIAFGFCIIGIALSKISISTYASGLVKALPYILVIGLINLFINPVLDQSRVLLKLWIFKISIQDINLTMILFVRFIIFMLAISITSANFSISRFIHGLEDLLKPLTLLQIPVHDFIVSVEIAIRYIPILTLIAERIAKSQASRGAVWGVSKGRITDRIKQIIPLILPLFLQSFQKADKIAMAMDARGYGLTEKRSQYFISRVKPGDIILLVLEFLLFLATLLLITNH